VNNEHDIPSTYTHDVAKRYHDGDKKGSENIDFYKSQVASLCGDSVSVLDLGCGTGRYIDALVNVEKYVGVDMSPHMQVYAREICNELSIDSEFFLQSIFEYSVVERSFDLIICIGIMNEQVNFFNDKFILDCERGLKKGGKAYFTVNAKDRTPLTKKQIDDYLNEIGVNDFSIGCRDGRGNENQIWKHWLVTILKGH